MPDSLVDWSNNGPPSCGRFLNWKIFALGRLPALAAAVEIRVVIATVPMIQATALIPG
jgi:hypothetical protein